MATRVRTAMTPPKRLIPVTPLVTLYRKLRGSPQAERYAIAIGLAANADRLARDISKSIQLFRSYENVGEAFCRPHNKLSAPPAIVNGRTLAAALAQQSWRPSGTQPLPFSLIDYEVCPARTTAKAPIMANAFDDGKSSRATMKIDLLLRHQDGTPIIGEAKVVTGKGFDTDPVLALIQALAGATQFASAKQRERLAQQYGKMFKPTNKLDVAVIAYHPAKLPNATYQARFEIAAQVLAERLQRSEFFPPEIRHIHFLLATGPPQKLRLERAPRRRFSRRIHTVATA